MRPLLAIILSAVVLLGVQSYLRFADSLRHRHAAQEHVVIAPGKYSADITLTFPAEADSFGLDGTSLVFHQQGKDLLKREGLVPAGEPLQIETLPDVVVGKNAFYFSTTPKESEQSAAKAVRVRIFRDGQPIAEQTFWSEPGLVPRGEIIVDVPGPATITSSHDHSK